MKVWILYTNMLFAFLKTIFKMVFEKEESIA